MAPAIPNLLPRADGSSTGSVGAGPGDWRAHAKAEDFILEGWSEGFMVGALLIMCCITVANMRKGVLLHKLILTEQLLAMSHGTFAFMAFKGYGWYLSSTAALLYCSWIIHNIVAWMKIRPFFIEPRSMFKPKTGMWVRRIYLTTLACTIPPIILQIFDNFRFFNELNTHLYVKARPFEPLFRDPWWIFTCITLFHVIRKCYGTGVVELIRRSPRFGILLCAIFLSLTFTALDIAASIHNFIGTTDGINPWWKLSLVMKCLTDTIMLDDFKTELKKLGIKRLKKEEERRQSFALVVDDKQDEDYDHTHDELEYGESLSFTNPAALRQGGSPNGFGNEPTRRDTTINQTGALGGERKVAPKAQVGRGGLKVSRLPGLKSFGLPGKKKSVDSETESQRRRKRPSSDDEDEDDEARMTTSQIDRVANMRASLGIIDYRSTT